MLSSYGVSWNHSIAVAIQLSGCRKDRGRETWLARLHPRSDVGVKITNELSRWAFSRGLPSGYGNRFCSPTTAPLATHRSSSLPPYGKPCTRLGMNIANLRVEERTVLTQPYSVLSLQPKLAVAPRSRSPPPPLPPSRAAHQTPFFPFSRFVPRFHFLFLFEKRTKERDETRGRWGYGGEWTRTGALAWRDIGKWRRRVRRVAGKWRRVRSASPSATFSLAHALYLSFFLFLPFAAPLPRGIGKNKINCSTYPIRWQSRCPGDADSLLSSMLFQRSERCSFLFLSFPLSSRSASVALSRGITSRGVRWRRREERNWERNGLVQGVRVPLDCLFLAGADSRREVARRSVLLLRLFSFLRSASFFAATA